MQFRPEPDENMHILYLKTKNEASVKNMYISIRTTNATCKLQCQEYEYVNILTFGSVPGIYFY